MIGAARPAVLAVGLDGRLGAELYPELIGRGHDVYVVSEDDAPIPLPKGVIGHVAINLSSGDDVEAAAESLAVEHPNLRTVIFGPTSGSAQTLEAATKNLDRDVSVAASAQGFYKHLGSTVY